MILKPYTCLFVQMTFCGQEVSNVITAVTLGLSSGGIVSSQEAQEIFRFGTPPIREDDKDGHYVFAVGDNLTPRCNYLTII
jgi:dual-specificity kinase